MPTSNLQIAQGADIEHYAERLGRFRIEIFAEYPYLYDGNIEYERKYLARYAASPNSFLIFCEDASGFVAACTGICMKDADEEFQRVFEPQEIAKTYYIGEVMIRNGYRGKGIGSKLLTDAVSLIKSMGFKQASLCAVEREENHPLRPNDYVSPDNLWRRFGFKKLQEKKAQYSWKDIGAAGESQKLMSVWTVEL